MRIGVDSGVTSRIDGALAGIDYEYTWAWDASKQTSVSGINRASNYNASIVDDGINIDYNGTQTLSMAFEEADFTTGSVSGGTGIADGSVSQTASGALTHPGRYFSTVATIHELTVADGTLSNELFGFVITINGGGFMFNFATNGGDPTHINGNPRTLSGNPPSLAMTQSEINSLIGRPLAVTYDLSNASYVVALTSDDPSVIDIYPAQAENVNMNATIHGFILSNKPPRIYHTPIQIGNPSI